MIESVLIRGHFGNPKRQRGTESRSIVPRQLFLKLRFFLHPPACGRVGRGSGRGGPSPGLRARLARLSQRESEISCRGFMWCLVVGRTKDAVRAGTAQTPPLCRRDCTINDVSTCVRSSGKCSVCSVRPTPRAKPQNWRISALKHCFALVYRLTPADNWCVGG